MIRGRVKNGVTFVVTTGAILVMTERMTRPGKLVRKVSGSVVRDWENSRLNGSVVINTGDGLLVISSSEPFTEVDSVLMLLLVIKYLKPATSSRVSPA